MSEQEHESPKKREALHYLYDSAIEAERKTGRSESSEEKARRSLIVRLFTIVIGFVIVTLGLIMMVLPGPGLIVTAIGLAILSRDIPFARRLRESITRKLPQDENGKLTKRTIIYMIVLAFAGIVLGTISIWWTFFRS